MTITATATTDIAEQVRDWLAAAWDPDRTVADWWEQLGLAGWAAPSLPTNAFGHGLSRSESVTVAQEIAAFGAVGAPAGLGLLLAAPTIAEHGTQEQIDTYVRDIVTGRQAWCQLFSEPGAGSDLAGLTTRAVRDGDEWTVNGQKVWTSMGTSADLGMLLARTDPDAPKHQGITWFACDMHQQGVELRPLREMTGHAMFNEVFLTDARVRSDAVIGDLNRGWAVANTTLANERAGLGAGGAGGGPMVAPGTVAGNLERRVGDFVKPDADRQRKRSGSKGTGRTRRSRSAAAMLTGLAQTNGTASDPTVRQGLARLHTLGELGRLNNARLKDSRNAGHDIPGMANIAKLMMSDMVRLQRDLGLQIVGADGLLHAYTRDQARSLREAVDNPLLAAVTSTALYAQAPPIYGGTDQVQRNIIGERVLGLPREPGPAPETPFSELPKNA